MEQSIEKAKNFRTLVDAEMRVADMGKAATGSETYIEADGALPLAMDNEAYEKINDLRYAPEVIKAVAEFGNIEDEADTKKVLLARMGMDSAPKQRRNNIELAVQQLSTREYGSLFIVKKILQKRPDKADLEVFAPLNKFGSFIVLDKDNYAEYKNLSAKS